MTANGGEGLGSSWAADRSDEATQVQDVKAADEQVSDAANPSADAAKTDAAQTDHAQSDYTQVIDADATQVTQVRRVDGGAPADAPAGAVPRNQQYGGWSPQQGGQAPGTSGGSEQPGWPGGQQQNGPGWGRPAEQPSNTPQAPNIPQTRDTAQPGWQGQGGPDSGGSSWDHNHQAPGQGPGYQGAGDAGATQQGPHGAFGSHVSSNWGQQPHSGGWSGQPYSGGPRADAPQNPGAQQWQQNGSSQGQPSYGHQQYGHQREAQQGQSFSGQPNSWQPSSGPSYPGQQAHGQQGSGWSGQPGHGAPYQGQFQYQSQPGQGQPYGGQPSPGGQAQAPQFRGPQGYAPSYSGQSGPGQPQYGQPYGQNPAGHGQNQVAYGQPYGQNSQTHATAKPASAPSSPLVKFGLFLPALLGVIAPFLTWVTFKAASQTVALNGLGGNSNTANADLGGSKNTAGVVVLLLTLALIVVAVLAVLGKAKALVTAIVSDVIGMVVLFLGIAQFISAPSEVSGDGPAAGYSATIGAGVWLTVLAGLTAIGVGVVAFVESRKAAKVSI